MQNILGNILMVGLWLEFREIISRHTAHTMVIHYGSPELNAVWHIKPVQILSQRVWWRPILYFWVFVS